MMYGFAFRGSLMLGAQYSTSKMHPWHLLLTDLQVSRGISFRSSYEIVHFWCCSTRKTAPFDYPARIHTCFPMVVGGGANKASYKIAGSRSVH